MNGAIIPRHNRDTGSLMEYFGNSWTAAFLVCGLGAVGYIISNLSGGGGSLLLAPVVSHLAGAKAVGMRAALVLTGVATRDDVARLPAAMRPDWVVPGLPELM